MQTIVTGSIGFILLLFRKVHKKTGLNKLGNLDLLLVYLSLFWLREPFNILRSVSKKIWTDAGSFFGGDEYNISNHYRWWEGSVSVVLGVIGLLISLFVVFRIVPKARRVQFIIGGLLGGSLGYLFWNNFLGPILLP